MTTFKQLVTILKGGPGSGNFGHAGVPGQRGGSAAGDGGAPRKAPSVKYKGKAFTAKQVHEAQNERTRAERGTDPEYVGALQKLHGQKITFDDSVDLETQLAVHEALARQPQGTLQYMRDENVQVKVLDANTNKPREFSVGSNKFTEGGHADYTNGELVAYVPPGSTNYNGMHEIISHEAGHFGMAAALSYAAEGQNIENRMDVVREQIRTSVMATGSDSEQSMTLKRERVALEDLYVSKYKPMRDALAEFSEYSDMENGISFYAETYRNSPVGRTSDIFEYRGPNVPKYPDSDRTYPGRGSISRFANENFAEMTAYIRSGAIKEPHARKMAKKEKPKTYATYLKIERMLGKPLPKMHAKRI